MRTASTQPILPVEETVAHKIDVLDSQHFDSAPCDLDYRIHARLSLRDQLSTVGLFFLVSVLAIPTAAIMGTFVAPLIVRWLWAGAAVTVGIILALCAQLDRSTRDTDEAVGIWPPSILLLLVIPPFVWLVACLTGFLFDLTAAFLFLLAALSTAIAAADQIATHAVFWMTAQLRVDHDTATTWREDWSRRLIAAPTLTLSEHEARDPRLKDVFAAAVRARAAYPIGLLWLLAAVALPNLFIVWTNTQDNKTIGLQIAVATLFGLSLAAWLRSGGLTRMFTRSWDTLTHYFHYGKHIIITPSMFRSPCGELNRRQLLPLVASALLSVTLFSLADHSFRALAQPQESIAAGRTAGASTAELPSSNRALPPTLILPDSPSSAATFALSLVSVAAIAPVAFLLIVFIMIGPLVNAYYEALES
jgi:hypothetical protein